MTDIILATTGEADGAFFQALVDCRGRSIEVTRLAHWYERLTGRLLIQDVDAEWVLASFEHLAELKAASPALLRLLDVAGSTVGLFVLAAIFPVTAAAIWLEDRGPILYRQVRAGRSGRPFVLYKFRTMQPDAEADGQPRWADPQDERITWVGKILRRARLDEFPQFWNVFKGEMSLIGPRPERPEFIALLDNRIPFYRVRLLVKPGLTGWAQVNTGYAASVDHTALKLQYDLYYIKNRSPWLDLLILGRTLGTMLRLEGT